MPVLVDSSLWVHQLRKSGDPAQRDRVNALLASGEAAWCPAVRLELWRGVTSDVERKAPTTAFRVPGDSADAERRLRSHGVIASARGNVIRLAPHFYSTLEDVDRSLDALAYIVHHEAVRA